MAGAKAKVARRDKVISKPLYGKKVLLINLSGEDQFCASTGKKLPNNGMIVEWNGNKYLNWDASERAKKASDS